jgi:hypothetical protein
VRQTCQMPSVGPERNCHPVSSRMEVTTAPWGDLDSIAAARRGGESRVPAVARDAVFRKCRRDESSR